MPSFLQDSNSLKLHIGMWLLYSLFWGYMFIGEIGDFSSGILFTGFILAVQMLVVYVNVYVLIPAYLGRSKVISYCVLLLVLWLGCILLIGSQLHHFELPRDDFRPRTEFFFPVFLTIFSTSLPTFVIILYEKLQETSRIKQLEKETVEHELKFLKAQINPHFLFNSINSIFQLIDTDTEKSKELLARFSEMLRYHLYETGLEKVPLTWEIEYLRSYAAMEKLRKSKNLEVVLAIQPDIGYLEVAPLIILTFVENAFKHVSYHYDRPNRVEITLAHQDGELRFSASNTTEHRAEPSPSDSGIGLVNVRKRLQLIYPDRHQLDIRRTDDEFCVELFITLQPAYELHHH